MTVDHHEEHLAPWLESGRALIVGLDGADGAPLATRAWGILTDATTATGVPSRVTVLLDAEDPQVVAALDGQGRIAVTGCDVHTLDSVQLKGTVRSLGPPTAAQSAASAEQVAATLAAIEDADAIPASLVARIVPGELVAAEVDLHAVFDQTPGPGAGCAMDGSPGPADAAPPGAPGSPGPAGGTRPGTDTGVQDVPGPVPDLGELWHCFEGVVPAVIATADAAGVPNVTYLSKVRSVDRERVALSNQFFSKTARNLAENPSAALLLIDPRTYDEYRLALRFERTERRGPVFEQLRADVEHLAVLSGMQDVFRLRAADIYRVTSLQRLPHAGAAPAPATAAARAPSMPAVGELAARLSRCGDAGDAVTVALRGLDELLGHDHSVFFLLDGEAGRLVVAGAHGYGAQAVGAEQELGRGEAGLAAQRGEPVRIGNLGQARRYSGRVQRSFGLGPPGPGWELPVPELEGVASRMAVPAMALGQLVGVLVVESAQHAAHGPQDEAALTVVAGLLAAAVEAAGAAAAGTGEPGPRRAPAAGRPGEGAAVAGTGTGEGPARRVRFFEADGSVFLDGDYLIKGVAGRVLWSLLRQHRDEGRVEFTNREVRLDTSLGLPEFRDNLDSRLLLLQRRLDEREAPVRITRTGRGRFRLEVREAVRLELGG